MMWTEDKLKESIKNGENSFTEFKEFLIKPEDLAKELTAFSNFKGGAIFIGVSDNGKIIGIDKPNVEEWVMNIASNNIEPSIIPTYQKINIESKTVIVVEVDLGLAKPYAVKKGDNRYYIFGLAPLAGLWIENN